MQPEHHRFLHNTIPHIYQPLLLKNLLHPLRTKAMRLHRMSSLECFQRTKVPRVYEINNQDHAAWFDSFGKAADGGFGVVEVVETEANGCNVEVVEGRGGDGWGGGGERGGVGGEDVAGYGVCGAWGEVGGAC